MAKPDRLAGVLLALSACCWPAAAQSIYRCGDSYGTQPCPGGTVVPTDDPRSAAQRAESRAATQRDARLAEEMESQRLKREATVARERATALKATKAASAPASAVKPKAGQASLKKPEVFTARAPRPAGSATATGKKAAP